MHSTTRRASHDQDFSRTRVSSCAASTGTQFFLKTCRCHNPRPIPTRIPTRDRGPRRSNIERPRTRQRHCGTLLQCSVRRLTRDASPERAEPQSPAARQTIPQIVCRNSAAAPHRSTAAAKIAISVPSTRQSTICTAELWAIAFRVFAEAHPFKLTAIKLVASKIVASSRVHLLLSSNCRKRVSSSASMLVSSSTFNTSNSWELPKNRLTRCRTSKRVASLRSTCGV